MNDKKERIKNNLLYAGLRPEEYQKIRPEITRGNVENLKIFTMVAASFLLLMFGLSFVLPEARDYRWVYFAALAVVLLVGVPVRRCALGEGQVLACICTFVGALYCFGILLGTVATPYEQTVSFVALLLTVPLLFTDRPIRSMGGIFLSLAAFVPAVFLFKDPSVQMLDVVNSCVFGAISAIVSFFMTRMKCQRYLYEHEVTVLSESDLLTGLRNRNSFEQRLEGYPARCRESLCCVYADANGLHELNNQKGHQAGDAMLRFIADALVEQFGRQDVYRIGGDEFVAFGADIDGERVEKRLRLVEASAGQKGYHVSLGYGLQPASTLNMNSLIKTAEARMYEEKRRYYEQLGMLDGRGLR